MFRSSTTPFPKVRSVICMGTMFLIPRGCFAKSVMTHKFEYCISIHELVRRLVSFNLTCDRIMAKWLGSSGLTYAYI
jgi:hypothetical protein